jgi:hypothetical protein
MALSDTNLLVRYYLDEAASGTTPTQVNDASGNDYHLTEINYGSGNLSWTEVSGNRGLASSSTTGTQRVRVGIDNTSDLIRDAMQGQTKWVMELVCDVDTENASTSRIFAIQNRIGSGPDAGLVCVSSTVWRVFIDNADWCTFDPGSGKDSRCVWHIVVNTDEATQNDRIKVYKNGSLLTTTCTATLSRAVSVDSDSDLILFNRESSGSYDRSFAGTIYYAALYAGGTFDATRVSDHYDVLTADDDTPSVGGSIVPQAMASYRQQ